MTAVDPGIDPVTSPTGGETQPAPVPASVRLFVLADEHALLPMTLPAKAPLAMLVGPTVKEANAQLGSQGASTLADRTRYEFARVDGSVLSDKPTSTLASCGLKDGDLLRLVPAGQAVRFVPRIENLASALAAYLRGLVKPVTPATAHAVAQSTLIIALLGAAVMVWRSRWIIETYSVTAAAVLAALAALTWITAIATAKRWPERQGFGDVSAATAILLTAVFLAAVPPGLGAPNVFLGAITITAGAFTMAKRTQRHWTAATALMCLAGVVTLLSGWSLFWPLSSYQLGVAGLLAVSILVVRAPKLGLTLSRVPRQPFRSRRGRDQFDRAEGQPIDTVSPVDDSHPDPTALSTDQLATTAQRARSVLVGVCTATAVVQIVSAWLVTTPHANRPVWTIVLVSSVAVSLIVSARKFNDRVQAVLLVGSSVAALMAIGYKYAWATPATDLPAVLTFIGIASVIALVIFLIGSAGWQYLFSPNTRKAVEWLGGLLVVAIPPLCAYLLNIILFFRTQGLWWR